MGCRWAFSADYRVLVLGAAPCTAVCSPGRFVLVEVVDMRASWPVVACGLRVWVGRCPTGRSTLVTHGVAVARTSPLAVGWRRDRRHNRRLSRMAEKKGLKV